MNSPFPGMDPYLEDPDGWLDVHNPLIAYLHDDLNASLAGPYVARITERVVVERSIDRKRAIRPDVADVTRRRPRNGGHAAIAEHATPLWVPTPTFEIPEWGIEIRASRGKRLVTAIEILSPSNKSSRGEGRELYLRKQRELLASKVNLVEIDLLRAGAWTVAVPWDAVERATEFDYAVSVSRAADRNGYEFYPIRLEDRLPRIAIPLDAEDPDAVADLQSLLDRCYTRGKYADDIDYTKPPAPPLPTRKAAWARRIVRGARRK